MASSLTRHARAIADQLQLPQFEKLTPADLMSLPGLPYTDALFCRRLVELQLDGRSDQGSRRPGFRAQLMSWFSKFILPEDSVIHPMCGPGLILGDLPVVGRYVGVDINPFAIAHARLTLKPGTHVSFETANAIGCDLGDNMYSLALLTYESVNAFDTSTLRMLFAAIRRALVPGGRLLLDFRPCAGFLKDPSGQATHTAVTGSLFSQHTHFLVDEWRYLGRSVFVHRLTLLPITLSRPAHVFHTVAWLYSEYELDSLLLSFGFRKTATVKPFVNSSMNSDVPEMLEDIAVVYAVQS